MPEDLTQEEQDIYDIRRAKYDIRTRIVELMNIAGEEETREFLRGTYPLSIF